MRTLKSPNAELENKLFIFKEIGLIISLGLVLWAFEFKSYDRKEIEQFSMFADDAPEEMVEITLQNKPPPPKPLQQSTIIEIVENDIEIEQELEIDVEADQDTEVEKYMPVEIIDEEEEEEEEALVFTVVESMPKFPGGERGLLKYLADNIRYPEMARESGIQGRVFVSFIVETDGSISDIRVLRGIGGGCDEEAIRVVEYMPEWIPGKQRNKLVRVQFNLPIRFVLR